MHKKYLALSICIIESLMGAQQPKTVTVPIPNGGQLNFTVNLNNTQDTKSNNSTTVSTVQLDDHQNDSPLLKELAEFWPNGAIPANVREHFEDKTSMFLHRNRWRIITGLALGSYAALCYFAYSANSYLNDPSLWAVWRAELPFDQVLAIPQPQFSQELIKEIQRRYTDVASMQDLSKSLMRFITAIEQEEAQIRWYQKIYTWLVFLRLTKIIPFGTPGLAKIDERLQRIAYYKNTLHSWIAEYQLEHAAKSVLRQSKENNPGILAMAKRMNIALALAPTLYANTRNCCIN